MPLKNDRYTYLLTWSEDDLEYVGSCVEFPSLSCLDKTPEAALKGIRENVQGIIKDTRQTGGETPGLIRFGSSIIVDIQPPNKVSTKRNIKAGQDALARAMWKIIKPGVVIKPIKDVPLYYADPNRKGIIIRELNGKRELGIFKNSKFKQCP